MMEQLYLLQVSPLNAMNNSALSPTLKVLRLEISAPHKTKRFGKKVSTA